jgi:hypothetical protein
MVAHSAVVQGGTVAQPVQAVPAVRVMDASSNPARGVHVHWSILEGSGELSQSSSVTGSNGVATLGSWVLGNATGLNRLSASAASLTSVEFQATASAGPATALQQLAGNNQAVFTGQVVPINPSVRVLDEFDNGVPSVPVTFAITAGSGTLTGAVQFTNQDGVATAGSWRVGVLAGPNTLTASIPGHAPTQFVANASVSARCNVVNAYVLQSVVNGSLSFDDCLLPNSFYHDFYQTVFGAAQAVRFTLQSAAFDPYLILTSVNGNVLAENDDASQQNLNSVITLVAPAGTIRVVPSSALTYAEGPYSLTSQILPNLNAQCGEMVFIMRGLTFGQNLSGGDCVVPGGPFFADEFFIRLVGGVPVTITMVSTELDPYLELFSLQSSAPVAENDDISGVDFNARINFTPPVSNYYIISASSHFPDEVGAYELTISPDAGGSTTMQLLTDGNPVHALLRHRGVALPGGEKPRR